MSDLSQYLEELSQGGKLNSEGVITLNVLKAQTKLDSHKLEAPHHYVLPLVAAAVLSGATLINFEGDFQNLQVDFDGKGFTQEQFAEVFHAEDGRAGALADCLRSAQSLGPSKLRLASTSGDHILVMSVVDGEPEFSRLPIRNMPYDSKTSFSIVAPRTAGMPSEIRPFLAERCGYNPAVAIEGRRVHIPSLLYSCGAVRFQSPHPGDPAASVISWVNVKKEHKDISGQVWFTDSDKSHLSFIRHGVSYPKDVKFSKLRGLYGVVSCPRFRLDISQSGVVEDEVFQAVLNDIESIFLERVLPQILKNYRSMMPRDRVLAKRVLKAWSFHLDQSTRDRIKRRLS